jgi:hypothetical protein
MTDAELIAALRVPNSQPMHKRVNRAILHEAAARIESLTSDIAARDAALNEWKQFSDDVCAWTRRSADMLERRSRWFWPFK